MLPPVILIRLLKDNRLWPHAIIQERFHPRRSVILLFVFGRMYVPSYANGNIGRLPNISNYVDAGVYQAVNNYHGVEK